MTNPSEPPAPPATDDAEAPAPVDHNEVFKRAHELVELKAEMADLDDKLERLKKKRALIEAYLLDCFTNEPTLNRLNVNGYTIYMRKQGWATAANKAQAYDALIAAGLGDFALRTFNVQSVSSLYREWDKNGEPFPAELEGIIDWKDTYAIGMTKTSKRKNQ